MDGLVDIIDINDRRITQIQYEYDAELRNNPKNGKTPSEKTLRLKGSTYKSFLKEFDIQLPKSTFNSTTHKNLHIPYTRQSTCFIKFSTAKMVEETMRESETYGTNGQNNLGHKIVFGRFRS